MRRVNFYDTVDGIVSRGVEKGILQLYTEGASLQGSELLLEGRRVVNFGSCSYLGLEFDPRLKAAAAEAVHNYGTQFSSSRAYLSLGLYRGLEKRFEELFGADCVIAPTTTLGHIAALPVLVGGEDAVLMDHQLHQSAQMAVSLLKHNQVELLRHNRMDLLEEKLRQWQQVYEKVWYLADGIYSMFGDACPLPELQRLLEKYPKLHLYIDDAHGMSIAGRHGSGFVLQHMPLHPRMVLATSLAKGFATGGCVLVFPSREQARKVRNCGGPMITSGPLQPATLGAAIASADIHLTEEITLLQRQLWQNIALARSLLRAYDLPLLKAEAAICYVGLGQPRLAYPLLHRLLKDGFYLNLGVFPAVPVKKTGIRFTITALQSSEQIEKMVTSLHRHYREILKAERVSPNTIKAAFGLPLIAATASRAELLKRKSLKLLHYKHAETLPDSWDDLFGNSVSFDRGALSNLEAVFSNNPDDYNNWDFDYFMIRDSYDNIIFAGFFSSALWKDDIFSSAAVSEKAEVERKHEPDFLISRVLSSGCLLSEGEHIYLNRRSPLWEEALAIIMEALQQLKKAYKADHILLRDFYGRDEQLERQLDGYGYYAMRLPDSFYMDNLSFNSEEEFYRGLSRRSRQHYREDIRKFRSCYRRQVVSGKVSPERCNLWQQLYRQVKARSLRLNTFELPGKLFEELVTTDGWEVLELWLRPAETEERILASMVFCYQHHHTYFPMIIGINYQHNKAYRIYRQSLYNIILRARELSLTSIAFGFAAGTEKKKFGAQAREVYAFTQYGSSYQLHLLDHLK